jgi:F1F0 ATPase subunit 2
MSEALTLLLAWVAGAALGVVFFGGLWWTVRKALTARQPALWFFGSLLLRMAVVLPGFYFVSDGQWERLLACLLGFVIARFILIRLAGPPLEQDALRGEGAGHAP